ncbi:MAG: hypothetical protein ABR592_06800, partial [Nitriliruptorales bacterium]
MGIVASVAAIGGAMAAEATILDELDREWAALVASGRLEAALANWRLKRPELAGMGSVEELLGVLAHRPGDGRVKDRLLLALVELADGDPLAGRVVLETFRPALKAWAGWSHPLPRTEWVALVVASMWEAICDYPVERRRRRVAANLTWEVRHRLYEALRTHREQQAELGMAFDAAAEAGWLCEELSQVKAAEVLRHAVARGDVDVATARTIVVTRVAGLPLSRLAETADCSASTLRQRR